MNNFVSYIKRTFILELKKTVIYPGFFWLIVLIIPLYSLIQIVFLEAIYSNTSNFVGYSKYEAYVLFGTYTIVQGLGHMLFGLRLGDLKKLIRGGGQESFDMILVKPIDSQIFASLGRFNFGNVSPVLIAVFIVLYGLTREPHSLEIFNVISYILVIFMGVLLFYLLFFFAQTFLFWFPELQMTEALTDAIQSFGQFPSGLYKGAIGVIFNIVIPLTLMASIPAEFLLGKISFYMLFIYAGIVFLLFVLTRLFWNYSIKKYSSFSS